MSVRKICKPKGCRGSPRCDHPWWFDVMCQGKRWRMRVDDFASLRGAKEPVTSKQAAERVWEPHLPATLVRAGVAYCVLDETHFRLAGLGDQAIPLEAVDDEIALRFAELGDSRLTELESRAYDIALVWAATAVAMEDEYIDPRERQALERLLGVEHADKAVAFAESQGRPAVTAKLADAVARINAAGVVTRQKFLDTVRSLSASLGLTPQLTETWQLLERTLRLKDRRST